MTAVRCESSPDSPISLEAVAGPFSLVSGFRLIQTWWNEQFVAPVRDRIDRRHWLFAVVLSCFASVLLFPDNRQLLDPDEGRHAEIARSMLASGDWVVPYLHDRPYFEKPPLQYWLTMGAYETFGLEPWVARIVPAVAAWLTVILAFLWARVALGQRVAFFGGMCLCLSLEFVVLGRTVILDSLLTLFVVSSWLTAHLAISGERFRWRWWLVSAVTCGLGILTKGPVCLVLVLPVVWVFAWLKRVPMKWKAPATFAVVAFAVAAPWYVAMACKEPTYLAQFFWKTHILRYVQPFDHAQPWWFYAPVLAVGTFPWSLLWPAIGLFLLSRKPGFPARRTPALGYCVLLAVWPVLFFSLAGCKSAPYVLPVIVPLAMITGACLDAIIFMPTARRYRLLAHARQAMPCHAAAAVFLLSTITYLAAVWYGWLGWSHVMIGVAPGPCLAIGCLFAKRRVQPEVAWGLCAASCLAFGLFPSRDVYAGFVRHRSPIALARHIEAEKKDNTPCVLSADRAWYSASFVLGRTVEPFDTKDLEGRMTSTLTAHAEAWVFVRNDHRLDALVSRLEDLAIRPEVHRQTPTAHLALVVIRR